VTILVNAAYLPQADSANKAPPAARDSTFKHPTTAWPFPNFYLLFTVIRILSGMITAD
jgi:hypothetical protein